VSQLCGPSRPVTELALPYLKYKRYGLTYSEIATCHARITFINLDVLGSVYSDTAEIPSQLRLG
jgi:hypothetical protein